jgi:aldehyde dehydrogenase (NAD+)
MRNLTKFYIDGQWVVPRSTKTLPVLNPATEAQIGTVAMGNAQDVDRAVAAAKAAFADFSTTSKTDRLDLLHRLKAATERRFEDLAQAMRMEMGAPITMARSAQADAAIGHLQGFIDALEELEERKVLANGDILLREPIGVDHAMELADEPDCFKGHSRLGHRVDLHPETFGTHADLGDDLCRDH